MTTEELIAARRAEPWREALRKSKKNKELKALENQFTNSAQQTEIRSPEENDEDSGEPDYSKYLPKK